MSRFKLNGKKYLRIFDGEWSKPSLIYTPNMSIEPYYENPIDGIRITITETTAGFIFNWKQENNDDNSYKVQKDFYEYETLCTFTDLPIGDNPYIFGNLIGKMDVRITKNDMSIRSTLSKDSKIKNVNETFFVPRLEGE